MFTLFTMCSDYEEDAGEKRILVGVLGRSRIDAPSLVGSYDCLYLFVRLSRRLSRFLGSSRFLNHCGERDELDELEGDD